MSHFLFHDHFGRSVFTWAVCGRMSSWLPHVGRSLGRSATEPLLLIMEDDHLGTTYASAEGVGACPGPGALAIVRLSLLWALHACFLLFLAPKPNQMGRGIH